MEYYHSRLVDTIVDINYLNCVYTKSQLFTGIKCIQKSKYTIGS